MKTFVSGAVTSLMILIAVGLASRQFATSAPKQSATIHSTSEIENPEPPVKKSTSAKHQCHVKGSQYYRMTIHFRGYETLKDCLDDGGQISGSGKTGS